MLLRLIILQNSATVGGGLLGKELGRNTMATFGFGQIGLNLKVGNNLFLMTQN